MPISTPGTRTQAASDNSHTMGQRQRPRRRCRRLRNDKDPDLSVCVSSFFLVFTAVLTPRVLGCALVAPVAACMTHSAPTTPAAHPARPALSAGQLPPDAPRAPPALAAVARVLLVHALGSAVSKSLLYLVPFPSQALPFALQSVSCCCPWHPIKCADQSHPQLYSW
jgi:hypothetical protein